MKYIYKTIWAVVASGILASCADEFNTEFAVKKPENLAQYEYLNAYDALKTYVDRGANPNFKLGMGITVSDFLKREQAYSLACANFDELTAGNAMKYSSVVKDNGSMDFSQVTQFVQTARAANLSIYGHTLMWHAQQNNKYLNGLIADKPIIVDPNDLQEMEDAFVDYSTYAKFPFYVMGFEPQMIDGEMVSSNPSGAWIQYFVADGIPTTKGGNYKVTALIQGSAAGSLNVQMGDWSAKLEAPLNYTTEWKEVSIEFNAVPAESSFVIFQPGTFNGDIRIKWLKVTHSAAPPTTSWINLVNNADCENDDASSLFETVQTAGPRGATFGAAGTGADGVGRSVVIQSGDNPVNSWDTQFFVKVDHVFEEGEAFKFSMMMKADKAATISSQAHNNPGGYLHWTLVGSPNLTTEWQEYKFSGTIPSSAAGCNTIAFNLSESKVATTYYFDDIHWEIEYKGGIPLTPQEKADTLTWAMDRWIAGMMEACDGYVTAWDVVNEPLSGADQNGDGLYDLQSAKNVSADDAKNNFYWQDYLGNDFVRLVVKLARQHGPADMKLFVNDYNLESDWDDNGKIKSLIKWIERWESDGTTKIDGIGTQMHVSCYMNPTIQASKEEHIVKMFELMAASGKLIKISELDMGLMDADGNKVLTNHATEEQHKAMSDFYKFIIKKYFEIIPAAQRYGITQWAVTDSPGGSGWRAGEPIGLWSGSYNRKHTYAGFADGLSGK